MNKVTQEMVQNGLAAGYTPEEVEKGYIIEVSRDKAMGATHIRRIKALGKFDSDEEAADYAEQHDGIQIIRDFSFQPGDPDYAWYIDNQENRGKIIDTLLTEAIGSINVFMNSRNETVYLAKDVERILSCMHIAMPYIILKEISKEDIVALVRSRAAEYRKAVTQQDEVTYHYEDALDEFHLCEILHDFHGNSYMVQEVYKPDCLLLQNMSTGQFVVAEGIKSYHR